MLKKLISVALLSLGLSVSAHAQIQTTTPQLIGQIQVLATGGFYVTPSTGSWGASDAACANAFYVFVEPGNAAEWKSMLATAMTGSAATKNIQFWGQCNTDPLYFDADQIILQ